MRECRVCVLLSLHCGVHASMIGGGTQLVQTRVHQVTLDVLCIDTRVTLAHVEGHALPVGRGLRGRCLLACLSSSKLEHGHGAVGHLARDCHP